jgi:hypothetical protein
MISVFLRELEYYQGIIFLTTNRVKEIDDAIASRIHLPLKYKSLGLDTRRGIWKSFLKKRSYVKDHYITVVRTLNFSWGKTSTVGR